MANVNAITQIFTTSYLIIGFLLLILFVFWTRMLLDCAGKDDFTGSEKHLWLLIIIIGNIVGAIVYYLTIWEGGKNKKKMMHKNGMLSMCSNCKSIRDEDGQWYQIENFFFEFMGLRVTHGLCQSCIKALYPDFADSVIEHFGSEKS